MDGNRINPRRVFIASDSLYSPLGVTTEENMRSVMTGRSGISLIEDPALFHRGFYGARIRNERFLSEVNSLGEDVSILEKRILHVIYQALEISKDLRDSVLNGDTRLILATTKGDIGMIEGKGDEIGPRPFPGLLAERINSFLRLKTTPLLVSNACISGINAIITGSRLIEEGRCDHAIVVGADLMTRFVVTGFESFHSVSAGICKPYDAKRDGLNLGEAAGAVILTANRQLVMDSDPVVVEGGALTNDANHLSAPSRTGDGLGTAMAEALRESDSTPSQVDFINAHGTSTLYNDEMESKAVHFANLQDVPVQSLKPYFGHTLGASGVIESVAAVWQLKNSLLFGTRGYEEPGVPEPIKVSAHHRETELQRCIKSASGFGGCNAAVVFAKESASNSKSYKERYEWREISSFMLKGQGDFDTVIRERYRELELKDIKFFKMDDMCKMGVIATANLMKSVSQEENISNFGKGMFVANTSSSMDTDIRHQKLIDEGGDLAASPAVFVYTLPNIVNGETSIRNKFQGENTFFVTGESRKEEILEEMKAMALNTGLSLLVTGWCEFFAGKYEINFKLFKKERYGN